MLYNHFNGTVFKKYYMLENTAISKNKSIFIWLVTCVLLVFLMIFVGGLTRLTDSGLSITEWNPISGIIPPLSSRDWLKEFDLYKQTPEFVKINFNISLAEFKRIFLIEYFHRILGRITGAVFLLPFLYFLVNKQLIKSDIKYYCFIIISIMAQGVMGWLMVKSGLIDRPDVSHFRLAAHLGLAIFIMSLLLWKIFTFFKLETVTNKKITVLACVNIVLVFCQIILGAFVAGLNAGMIYNQFPLMGDGFVPYEFVYVKSFTDYFYDPAIIQFFHRILAYLVLINIFILAISSMRANLLKRTTLFLMIVVTLQVVLGVMTLLWQVPLVLASSHQLLAVILYSLSLFILNVCFKRSNSG